MKNHDRARLLVESYFALKNFLTTVGGWIGSLHPLASYFLRVMGDDFPEWIKTSLKGRETVEKEFGTFLILLLSAILSRVASRTIFYRLFFRSFHRNSIIHNDNEI